MSTTTTTKTTARTAAETEFPNGPCRGAAAGCSCGAPGCGDDAEYPSLTPAQRNRAEEIASRACGGRYGAEQARAYAARALASDDPEMLERAEMWAED